VPVPTIPPTYGPDDLAKFTEEFDKLPADLKEKLGGSPDRALLSGSAQIIIPGQAMPHAADAHRHGGVFGGSYDPQWEHSNMERLRQQLEGPIQEVNLFSVSPHVHDRPEGLDTSVPGHPVYYLIRKAGPDGGPTRVEGTATLGEDGWVTVEGYGIGPDGQSRLRPGRYKIAEFNAFFRGLAPHFNRPGNVLTFLSTPPGSTLGYIGPVADQGAIDLLGKQIRTELDTKGQSLTAQKVSLGVIGGSPFDPAGARLFYRDLAYANKLEKDLGLPPGSIRISGAGEITISKETVSLLVGMPSFSRGGQNLLDALSQMLSPWRYAGGIVIIHCDSGEPSAIFNPAGRTGITPGIKNVTIPIGGPSGLENVDNLIKFIKQNPDQKFILAHFLTQVTATIPEHYLNVMQRILDETRNPVTGRSNVVFDGSWDVFTNQMAWGQATSARGRPVNRELINAFAEWIATHPDSALFGSDTIAGDQDLKGDPSAATLQLQKDIGFLDAIREAGIRHGNPHLLEQYLHGNYERLIKQAADNVGRFRTAPENTAWIDGGGPSDAHPLPPMQMVELQQPDGTWKWDLVRTEDLPVGMRDRNALIVPNTLEPMVGVPGIIWTDEGRVPGPRNSINWPVNRERRAWLESLGIYIPDTPSW
jgi:hypothetical protein